MQKKLTAMTLALLMILSITASALAIQPRWNSTNSCDPSLSFTGTTAICRADVRAIPGAEISGTMTLYRVSGSNEYNVDSWDVSGTGTAYVSERTSVTKGETYRLEVSVTVSGSYGKDTITVDATKTCK